MSVDESSRLYIGLDSRRCVEIEDTIKTFKDQYELIRKVLIIDRTREVKRDTFVVI
jgi:hypothetical protein